MTTISLGYRPISLNVALSADTDFVSALVASVPWPDGTSIALEFEPATGATTVWPATIAADRASWYIPAAQVATLLAVEVREVRLRYTDPDGTVLTWARGGIVGDRA